MTRHSTVPEKLLSLDLSRWSCQKAKALQSHFSHLADRLAEQTVYCIVNYMGYGDYLNQREVDRGKIPIVKTITAQVQTPAQFLERLKELRELVKSGASGPKFLIVLSKIHSPARSWNTTAPLSLSMQNTRITISIQRSQKKILA